MTKYYHGRYIGAGSIRKFGGKTFKFKKFIDYGNKIKLESFMSNLRLKGWLVRKTPWNMKGHGSGYNIWIRRK